MRGIMKYLEDDGWTPQTQEGLKREREREIGHNSSSGRTNWKGPR